jgi:DNA-binding transcriptional MocR family regulator
MRRDGYFTIERDVLARLPEIKPLAFAVYAVLASHADEEGRCWPSVAAMARAVGCSAPTVKRALRDLKDAGLIGQQRRRQSTPIYTIQEVSPVSPQEQEVSPVSLREITGDPQEVSPVIHRTTTKERQPKNDKQEGSNMIPQDQARKSASAQRFDPLAVDLPFGSAAFRESWIDFGEMRAEKKKPLTERAAKIILKKLAAWGEPAAIEALEASTVSEWQGVFPPKSNGTAKSNGEAHTCKVLSVEEYRETWNPTNGGN